MTIKTKNKNKKEMMCCRPLTREERIFINQVYENYRHNIGVSINNSNLLSIKNRNHFFISIDNEIVVKIYMEYDDNLLITDCYFSGKCEMYFLSKKSPLESFSVENVNNALNELSINN